MKFSVALFFAGLFGALGTGFILLSFGTDYWFLVWETGETGSPMLDMVDVGGRTIWCYTENHTADDGIFYSVQHEGFFWRCAFGAREDEATILKFWFTNQPRLKVCTQAYLYPFPLFQQTHNATNYESAIIYKGFWSVFMLLGVTAVILGGFIIICAAPFSSPCLYKAGGGLLLIAGFFILLATVLLVFWLESMDVVRWYEEYKKGLSPGFELKVMYGPSFMVAPVGVFFCLLSGLFFLLIGQALKKHYY